MRRRKWAALVLVAFCVLGSTQKAAGGIFCSGADFCADRNAGSGR